MSQVFRIVFAIVKLVKKLFSKLSKKNWLGNFKNFWEFWEFFTNILKIAKIVKKIQIVHFLKTNVKIVELVIFFLNCQKVKICQQLSISFKIVKSVKNDQKFSKYCSGHIFSSLWSSHKSLGSLFVCQVVKSSVTERVTRSPIELFCTAKKD